MVRLHVRTYRKKSQVLCNCVNLLISSPTTYFFNLRTKKLCDSPESNRGLVDGNDKFYH